MGRPQEYFEERKVTAVRFPLTLRHELKAVAEDQSISVNRLVNTAVRHFLKSFPDGDQVGGAAGAHESEAPLPLARSHD